MPDDNNIENSANNTQSTGAAAAAWGFALALLLLGAAALGMSLELWQSMSEPRASSAAALPLFVSALWTLAALYNLIRTPRGASGEVSGQQRFIGALRFALPPRTALTLLAVAAYCALLLLGVSFYISTPLFLYGTMCLLCRGDYLKNLLRTAAVTLFIVLVFRVLFGVAF